MKLPEWSPSISTAMPMKDPAIQGSPAMVRPAVQTFQAIHNANDYLRLADAKMGKYAAIGNTVIGAIDIYQKITVASEEAEARTLVARDAEALSKHTTAVTTDQRLYIEDPETGEKIYHWETAGDDFDRLADEQETAIKTTRKLKTPGAQSILNKGLSVNRRTYREKIQKFTRDRQIDKGRADLMERVDLYVENGNIDGLEEARAEGIQSGLYEAKTWHAHINKKQQDLAYGIVVNDLAGMSLGIDRNEVGRSDFEEYKDATLEYLSEDVTMRPEDKRKAIGALDDMEDTFDDRVKTAQDTYASDFIVRWMQADTKERDVLGEEFSGALSKGRSGADRAGPENAITISKLVGRQKTVGTKNRGNSLQLQKKISDFGNSLDSSMTPAALWAELVGLNLSEEENNIMSSRLHAAIKQRQSGSVLAFKDGLSRALTPNRTGYKALLRKIDSGTATPGDVAALGILESVAADMERGILEDPGRDWRALGGAEALKRFNPIFMTDSTGAVTKSKDEVDVAHSLRTLELLPALLRDIQTNSEWKGRWESVLKNGVRPNDPQAIFQRRELWKEYLEANGYPEYLIDGQLPNPRTIFDARKALETLKTMRGF